MSFKIIIIFLALLASSLYIAFLNPYDVPFTLYESLSFNVPLIILIMFSFFSGAFVLFLINLLLSSKSAVKEWKVSVNKKRRQKIEDMSLKGRELLFRGKSNQAYLLLKKVLKKDPKHMGALHTLGNFYRKTGKYDKAIDYHSRAHLLNKDNIEILYSLASDYEKTGNFSEASCLYEEIKNIDNDTTKPLYELRRIYTKGKDWERACKIQEDILGTIKASDSDKFKEEKKIICKFYMEKGLCFEKKNDYKSAKKEIKRAIKTDNGFMPAYIFMSELLLKEGKTRHAEKILKEGYKNTAAPIFLRQLEDIYNERDAKHKMIEIYRKAIASDLNNPILNLMLAGVYLKLDMLDESLEELKKAEEYTPAPPLLRKIKGAIFEKKDDMNSAAKEYRKILDNGSLKGLFFSCIDCGHYLTEWKVKCPKCCNWNIISQISA